MKVVKFCRFVFFTLFVWVVSFPVAAQNQTTRTLTKEIQEILKDTGIPSISIALLQGDRIIWSEAFGYSNVKLKTPASPNTIYSTGSCFKPVTAMAVMQLAEKGKFKLDDPINKYLGGDAVKDMTESGKPVTFRHLLSHYSGLTTTHEMMSVWERRLPKSLRELASEMEAEQPPGTKFQYSNSGYALAGLLIDKVSGQSYERYIVQNILRPLGIKLSGPVHPTAEMLEELAFPYRLEIHKPVPERPHRFDVYPAGDIYLSVPAMAKVLLTHLNGGKYGEVSLLSEASIKEMHKPQFGGKTGLDFGIREIDRETLITHGGGVPGYSTMFILGVDSKVGVYIASNAGGARMAMTYLAQLSIDLLLGKEVGTGLVREIVGIGTALAGGGDAGKLRISDVIPKSPARQAGVSAGMVIEKINGVATKGKSIQECIQIMDGPVGTNVRLELFDPDRKETKTVDLKKQKIFIAS